MSCTARLLRAAVLPFCCSAMLMVASAQAPDGARDHLDPGDQLLAGDSLVSASGRYWLVYQGDGNLVLYDLATRVALWWTGTVGESPGQAVMQGDGNFVVYNADASPVWWSATEGNAGARLVVQDDANVVVYTGDVAVWSAGSQRVVGDSELAFVHDGQIFRVLSDGTDLVQLTNESVNSDPAWSSDGRRIAFVRHQDGSSELYVMDADGTNVVRRSDGGAASPAWSPDGTRIAFSSLRDGQYGIYVMRADGDRWNPVRLGFDQGWSAHPAWSPDGSRIAFVSDVRAYDFLSDLYVMNADGSDVRLLTSATFHAFYFQPAWSTDGGTIALTFCGDGGHSVTCFPDSTVALVNADGSGLRSIASASGFARPSWSPDGRTIAFGSSECSDCQSSIRYVTSDGSHSGVLVWDGHSPTWRP